MKILGFLKPSVNSFSAFESVCFEFLSDFEVNLCTYEVFIGSSVLFDFLHFRLFTLKLKILTFEIIFDIDFWFYHFDIRCHSSKTSSDKFR